MQVDTSPGGSWPAELSPAPQGPLWLSLIPVPGAPLPGRLLLEFWPGEVREAGGGPPSAGAREGIKPPRPARNKIFTGGRADGKNQS